MIAFIVLAIVEALVAKHYYKKAEEYHTQIHMMAEAGTISEPIKYYGEEVVLSEPKYCEGQGIPTTETGTVNMSSDLEIKDYTLKEGEIAKPKKIIIKTIYKIIFINITVISFITFVTIFSPYSLMDNEKLLYGVFG